MSSNEFQQADFDQSKAVEAPLPGDRGVGSKDDLRLEKLPWEVADYHVPGGEFPVDAAELNDAPREAGVDGHLSATAAKAIGLEGSENNPWATQGPLDDLPDTDPNSRNRNIPIREEDVTPQMRANALGRSEITVHAGNTAYVYDNPNRSS